MIKEHSEYKSYENDQFSVGKSLSKTICTLIAGIILLNLTWWIATQLGQGVHF